MYQERSVGGSSLCIKLLRHQVSSTYVVTHLTRDGTWHPSCEEHFQYPYYYDM